MPRLIKVAICDDKEIDSLELKKVTELFFKSKKINTEIIMFSYSRKLLRYMEQYNNIHIVILDIILNEENGIETAKKINTLYPDCHIIFVSINPDYFKDVYYASHLHFLVKPIECERLNFALNSAVSKIENSCLTMQSYGDIQKIPLKNISHLEVRGHNTLIYMINGEIKKYYISLNELEQNLNSSHFIRCHRSFIINAEQISSYKQGALITANGISVPVGRKYEKSVESRLFSFWHETL